MRAARLLGSGSCEELAGLFGGGQGADDVQVGAAEEDAVGSGVGGR